MKIKNKKLKGLLAIGCLLILAFLAYYLIIPPHFTDSDPIQRYRYFEKSKIIDDGLKYDPVKSGDNFIVMITEGMSASKRTTAHAHWDSVYFALNKEPVAGMLYEPISVYWRGYRRRTREYAVDPETKCKIKINCISKNTSSYTFNISGVVPIKRYYLESTIDIKEYKSKDGYKRDTLGGINIVWSPYSDKLVYSGNYECSKGVMESAK